MSLKVFLLACRRSGFDTAKALLDSGHMLDTVVTADFDGQVNDGYDVNDFRSLLEGTPTTLIEAKDIHSPEVLSELSEGNPDVGISMGWRRLVRRPVLDIPRLGCFNFHTSDLPRYRGFASTSWAILNGDDYTAITAHQMIDGVADEGDIVKKHPIPIDDKTTISSLFEAIFDAVPGMCLELLDELSSGQITRIPQSVEDTILSFPRHPSDGWIDWHAPAVEIDRLVRAVSRPYPGARTCLKERRVTVWKGHVLKAPPRFAGIPGHVAKHLDDGTVWVLTGQGIYVLEEAEMEDAPTNTPSRLFPGMQNRLGLGLEDIFLSHKNCRANR